MAPGTGQTVMKMTFAEPHRVVVIGGGFAGLQAVKAMARLRDAEITLIDRQNYHLFQPLSYQVATGALAPAEIAIPLRRILRRQKHVRVLLGEVTGFDLEARQVTLEQGALRDRIRYDTLIVAGGSEYSYFGHEDWRSIALEVKSLDSALRVRGRILRAFECAELEPDRRESWLTFVVVGAGPTGVEMSGQIAELARRTLRGEFREFDPGSARVLLVEAGDKVLGQFPGRLPERARRSLEHLGVTPMLGQQVVGVDQGEVELEDRGGVRSRIKTHTVIWAAGVTASPLARMLADASGGEVDRSGRLQVEPDLSLAGHPEVLAIGDMVSVRDPGTGEPKVLPGLAPVAMQQGRYAGTVIKATLKNRAHPAPFHYRDKGELATIGRARAVGTVKGIPVTGFLAWALWLGIHITYLVGFQNRVVVLTRWAFAYVTRGRGARVIHRG
jgi:NADH:ubiquinone reductase (H+-translocating)